LARECATTWLAQIEQLGGDLFARSPGTDPAEVWIDGEAARPALEQWAGRYSPAAAGNDDAEPLAIGREIFAWLDGTGWATAWLHGTSPPAATPGLPTAPAGTAR